MKDSKLRDFAKEHRKGSMVGLKRVLWRPNNYRRGLIVKLIKGVDVESSLRSRPGGSFFPVEISFSPSNKLYFVKFSSNIKVMVAPTRIMGIWSQNKIGKVKETFLIERVSEQELERVIDEKKRSIRDELDSAMGFVCKCLDVAFSSKDCYWVRHEDWIKGEEFVDSLPREVIIHDTVFKKVYGDGLEFVGNKGVEPGVRIKNYLKNRALEDFSPEIVGALNAMAVSLKDFVDGFSPVLAEFASDVRVHNRVLKSIERSFGRFNRLLGERQKRLGDF